MRYTWRIPRRTVRTLFFVVILLAVTKLFWISVSDMYKQDHKLVRKYASGVSEVDIIRVNEKIAGLNRQSDDNALSDVSIESKTDKQDSESDLFCQAVKPFNNPSRGDTISTFDLPNITDYSLDAKRRYKIPNEFFKDSQTDDGPIQVIVVPFSHADPGYGQTVEGYYQSSTKSVLDNMIVKLNKYRNMTFQWAETVFLERWFRDITEAQKVQVRDLVERGQLEIVMGSWVMPDEAITYYVPVVDQLIEGHQWLMENIGVTPKNAWINDPFGYSSTMPYLWKSSGMDNMVILRIHQAIKATLMRKKSMEFNWRPYWKTDAEHDILCNLMPYPGYWNGDVCGPDQSVCKQFNFIHLSEGSQDSTAVTDENISKLSKLLYEAYKFTAGFYQYNNLVIFIGEDNSYVRDSSWEDTYRNYDKLMTYINNKHEWNMNIKFGTLKEYFANVRDNALNGKRSGNKSPKESKKFPTLSGDFFPYSDWDNGYWTGYYTTRPWMKKFSRELGPIVRAADIFSVIMHNYCAISGNCANVTQQIYKGILSDIRVARRELGIYQHHDGITGTSLPFVVDDYETRLMSAYRSARKALKMAVMTILSRGAVSDPKALTENKDKQGAKSIIKDKLYIIGKDGLKFVLANSIEKTRYEVVNVLLNKKNIKITSSSGADIPFQATVPYISKSAADQDLNYLISFNIHLAPYVIQTIQIKEIQDNIKPVHEEFHDHGNANSKIEIRNQHMKAVFDSTTGFIKHLVDSNNRITEISSEFLMYKSETSGAYLFGPNGEAMTIPAMKRNKPQIYVTRGHLMSEVKVFNEAGFSQNIRLYNTSGIQGQALHIRNEVDLNKGAYSDTEVILRFKTDIKNGDVFFTDQNGFQIMGRRTYPDRLIESNYYPISTVAILEDTEKRLTLHASQPHGVASLKSGMLEVMLDRTMNRDDGKGLGMGVYDKVLTLSEFSVQIEHKTQPEPRKEDRFSHMTVNSLVLNEQFQNGILIFSVADDSNMKIFDDSFQTFNKEKEFPCDTAVVGLRNLVTNDLTINGTSLVLHRRPTHCSYPVSDIGCSVSGEALTFENFLIGLDSSHLSTERNIMVETSLSHIYSKQQVTFKDDIRPKHNELKSYFLKFKARGIV